MLQTWRIDIRSRLYLSHSTISGHFIDTVNIRRFYGRRSWSRLYKVLWKCSKKTEHDDLERNFDDLCRNDYARAPIHKLFTEKLNLKTIIKGLLQSGLAIWFSIVITQEYFSSENPDQVFRLNVHQVRFSPA